MRGQPSGSGCARIMSRLALMAVALALVSQSSASGQQDSHRIYGGGQAKEGKFPFIVSLRHRGPGGGPGGASYHYCGGTILDKRHILTAAHCVDKGNIEMFAMVGCHRLSRCKSVHKVARKVVHPKYSDSTDLYDIAVLKLANPILNLKRWPAPVSESPSMMNYCNRYTVAGWGATNDTIPQSQVLMKVDVDRMNWAECKNNFPNVQKGVNFCAGSADHDSCPGDSGGPLYLHCGGGAFPTDGVQIGIVSYGQQGCGKGTGGVYTNVPSFVRWIREIVKSPK